MVPIRTTNTLLIFKHLSETPIRSTYPESSCIFKYLSEARYAPLIQARIENSQNVPDIKPPFKTLNTPAVSAHILEIGKLQNIEPCIETHIEARIHGEYWHSYSKLDSRTVSCSISWPKAPQY